MVVVEDKRGENEMDRLLEAVSPVPSRVIVAQKSDPTYQKSVRLQVPYFVFY